MKIKFAALIIALLLAAPLAWADVADGLRAYDAGWYDDALEEFFPAAKAGDVRAQMALASMYQFGEGVAQSDTEAARWTRAAAERGDAVAQINLSQFYAEGRGVARDVAQRFFWLLLAAGQGNAWAETRLAAAAAGLADEDATETRARAANWSPLDGNRTGAAEVLDGETLIVGGARFRLEGIDAPAPGTRCRVRGNEHDCGRISTTALMDLTAGAEVVCKPREMVARDGSRYARCRAGGYDLSEGMADVAQMKRYATLESEARQARRGMWRQN